MTKRQIASPLALLAFLAMPPAFGADLTRFTVAYGDLDLNSAAGQAALKARLGDAAASVCHPGWMDKSPDSEFDIHYRQEIFRACVGRVTDRAMADIEERYRIVARN